MAWTQWFWSPCHSYFVESKSPCWPLKRSAFNLSVYDVLCCCKPSTFLFFTFFLRNLSYGRQKEAKPLACLGRGVTSMALYGLDRIHSRRSAWVGVQSSILLILVAFYKTEDTVVWERCKTVWTGSVVPLPHHHLSMHHRRTFATA